jgi:hypothetical protein
MSLWVTAYGNSVAFPPCPSGVAANLRSQSCTSVNARTLHATRAAGICPSPFLLPPSLPHHPFPPQPPSSRLPGFLTTPFSSHHTRKTSRCLPASSARAEPVAFYSWWLQLEMVGCAAGPRAPTCLACPYLFQPSRGICIQR